MSFISNLFSSTKPAEAPAAPVPAPTNNLATANPSVPVPQGEPPAPVSPLDKFSDVWHPKAPEENQQVDTSVTPKAMMEAASKVDFSRLIDQDTMAKITAGGEDAMRALVQVINKTNQTSFGQSMVAAQKLIESAVADARKDFTSQVPGIVKNQQLRESLYEKNQALKNPAVSPIVEALQTQLADKYPKASVQELNDMAEQMMLGAAQAFAPKVFAKPKSVTPKDQDWSNMF